MGEIWQNLPTKQVECDLMMSTDMDVPAKGFWRGNKSVVGKVPQEREGYEHCVSDESRKETTKQVSQGEETDRVEKVGRGQEVSKGKQHY